jgi:hypothetical protein
MIVPVPAILGQEAGACGNRVRPGKMVARLGVENGRHRMSRIFGAIRWVPPMAAVGALITGAAACSTPAPPEHVLDSSLTPSGLAEPITLARLSGPLAQCFPPAAPASDHGLCNVTGKVLTLTTARWVQAVNTGGEYVVQVQLSAAQQHALAAFLKPIGHHEVGIAVGTTPLVTMLFAGPPGGKLVFAPATAADAERLFGTLTGGA